MTVQEKMAQLQTVKSDIKQALIAKGVDMDGVQFTEYAGKVDELNIGVKRTHLFKDGILDPSIPLNSGLSIKNKIIYTNNAGGTTWTIQKEVVAGSALYVKLKCKADAGSLKNEASSSITFGGNIGIIRFPGDDETNKPLMIGVEAVTNASTITIYLYTYANAMGIEEMWIE